VPDQSGQLSGVDVAGPPGAATAAWPWLAGYGPVCDLGHIQTAEIDIDTGVFRIDSFMMCTGGMDVRERIQ
jgi:hypothetical protein